MDAIEVGLRMAIEALLEGLLRANVMDRQQLGIVRSTLLDAASSAEPNVPYAAVLMRQIEVNAGVMADRLAAEQWRR